jgi:hypothetical protein
VVAHRCRRCVRRHDLVQWLIGRRAGAVVLDKRGFLDR